jgi:outer membrane protein OmpA-like peptidoglycan-associated protein
MEVAVIATWVVMFIASIMNTGTTTTVVLADNHGKENAIVVQTDAGSTTIDKTGQYVSISSKNEAPTNVQTMSEDEINKKFKSAIEAIPLEPVHVNLYFKNNSNELTDASKEKLPYILIQIKERTPCDVSIIGHTDTKGSASYNTKLALERAKYVKSWVVSSNVELNNLKVESYGESDLLIQTEDNVAESRNRRVEIFIK